jgi:hypothetical protein
MAWIYGKIIKQMAWSFCNSSRHFLGWQSLKWYNFADFLPACLHPMENTSMQN